MPIAFKYITESKFIPAFKELDFTIKSMSKNYLEFFYQNNQLHRFFVEKDNIENAVSFFLSKPHTYAAEYAIREIILIRCGEPYKSWHEHALDKFYFDTDEN
jgi:hypothetical protein